MQHDQAAGNPQRANVYIRSGNQSLKPCFSLPLHTLGTWNTRSIRQKGRIKPKIGLNLVTGRAGGGWISPKTHALTRGKNRQQRPNHLKNTAAASLGRPESPHNITNVTSSDKTAKLYTKTLDNTALVAYTISKSRQAAPQDRQKEKRQEMNTNRTPHQDLKDALARYNAATRQQATIYKTPGGYWHIVSPDFSFLFSAKTRAELTAQLDAYSEGYLDGKADKMRELGLFRSVDELLD